MYEQIGIFLAGFLSAVVAWQLWGLFRKEKPKSTFEQVKPIYVPKPDFSAARPKTEPGVDISKPPIEHTFETTMQWDQVVSACNASPDVKENDLVHWSGRRYRVKRSGMKSLVRDD